MRLFLAIRMNEDIRKAVSDVQRTFRKKGARGSFVPEENLHVTAAFIGEMGDPTLVMDALEDLSFEPFRLTVDRVGCFGDIWWAGTEDQEALKAVAAKIRHLLSLNGIPFDRKKFLPHITFIRNCRDADMKETEINIRRAFMDVESISLMVSTPGKRSMIYTELCSFMAE
jgi:2'-5' RNA ligase